MVPATCNVRPGTGTPGRRRLGKAIDSFLDLHEGDLVVHVSHGIARYRGMKPMEKQGQIEEHLELEFQGKTKLYVPASKIGLVQKYVGGRAPGQGRPMLARLGGRLWEKQKKRVESAVTDMAAEMLELQAVRASRPGISFRVETEWQHEFDASFPYKETPDQLTTLEAIKQDMQAPRPMDRLLCGDVGYGKTEVAMRAAFKAIDSGYQVAVLVPTTILAEQHLRTFTARMAEFPFSIVALSRFATHRQQAEIIQRLAAGSVDVVIGTHRLVQPDVKFHNLGLIVIDEEQRFGVEVKERLKAMRQTVDVLTMTATPIPRTLHMGLIGVRDISNLETPPEDRLAVETRVTRFNPELVRQAVLRELNRQGQVYFVHNRVQDIQALADQARPDRARGPHSRRPRPDGRARTGAGDVGLRGPSFRHPAGDDDHRERPGHPQRQHDFHRRGRPLRVGRSAPASRPSGPLHPAGLLLSPAGPEQEPHVDLGAAPEGDRGIQPDGRRLRHRHARPGDPRRRQYPGHRAERPHRRGGLRTVLLAPATGGAASQAAAVEGRDRGRGRPAGRRPYSAQLCARHAVEDRPLPPSWPDFHAWTNWATCASNCGTASAPRRRWSSTCFGWPNCGLPPIAGESNRSTWSRRTSSSATARPDWSANWPTKAGES